MLLASLESVLNRNIADSSAARAACKRLAGKTLAVHLTTTPHTKLLSLYFTCSEQRIALTSNSDAQPAATLSGSPLAYMSMLRAQPEAAMRSGNIRIEGDAEAAQTFRDLLKAAAPDAEEELARVIGDVSAHQVGNAARSALQFGKRIADTFTQNVAEYLQEESRDVVTRIELDEFSDAVDKLRDAVERAEARMNNLQSKPPM
jgi:ubiquinone biosynthesis protein UbiJ